MLRQQGGDEFGPRTRPGLGLPGGNGLVTPEFGQMGQAGIERARHGQKVCVILDQQLNPCSKWRVDAYAGTAAHGGDQCLAEPA